MFFRTRRPQSRVEPGDTDSLEAGAGIVDDADKAVVLADAEVAGMSQAVMLAPVEAGML